jgi:LemA protein
MQVSPENLTPENVEKFQQAQGQLSGALSRLLVTVEQYPIFVRTTPSETYRHN